jgi:hypothetical protein
MLITAINAINAQQPVAAPSCYAHNVLEPLHVSLQSMTARCTLWSRQPGTGQHSGTRPHGAELALCRTGPARRSRNESTAARLAAHGVSMGDSLKEAIKGTCRSLAHPLAMSPSGYGRG